MISNTVERLRRLSAEFQVWPGVEFAPCAWASAASAASESILNARLEFAKSRVRPQALKRLVKVNALVVAYPFPSFNCSKVQNTQKTMRLVLARLSASFEVSCTESTHFVLNNSFVAGSVCLEWCTCPESDHHMLTGL